MQYKKINTIELLCDRFEIGTKTARQVEAILDGVIAPTTFSIVRECAKELSAIEQILTAVSFVIGGGSVQRIKHSDELIAYWVGRGDEYGWALVRNLRHNCWEVACPTTFKETHVARQS